MSSLKYRLFGAAVMKYITRALLVAVMMHVSAASTLAADGARAVGANKPNRISDVEWTLHIESNFAHPVKETWTAFKDMRRWYTEYAFELVSGPPYKAESGLMTDQVLKVTPSNGFPRTESSAASKEPESFILKTIEVIPEKEIVVVLWGSAFDWKQYTSFYVWKLGGQGETTTISVDSYGRAELVRPLAPRELAAYREDIKRNFDRSWAEAFANLNKVMAAKN